MNPKIVAFASGLAALFLAYSIFGPANEAPSRSLNTLNWVFLVLAIIGCVGSPIQILKKQGN